MSEQRTKRLGPLLWITERFRTIGSVRAAVWGGVLGMILVVGLSLSAAWIRNEQPFSRRKGVPATSIAFARHWAPVAAAVGSIAAILFARMARSHVKMQ